MLSDSLATDYRVSLPAWITDELADVPEVLPSLDERMRLVHRLTDRNWREGNGGPSPGSSSSATPVASSRSE